MAKKVRDLWQIALYVPPDLARKIKAAAREQHRGYAPTVLELLRRYFADREGQKAEEPDAGSWNTYQHIKDRPTNAPE